MPPRVRELESVLRKAGFINRGGHGNHRNYEHPSGAKVSVCGQPTSEAKNYLVREVEAAVEQSKTGVKK